jgi:HAD superfamily hydrolase (TIGR01484 family)
MTSPSPRRGWLVFSDNEGCLSPGKGLDFPLDELLELRNYLREQPSLQLSVCTGRSIPYVEALTQVLGLTGSETPCVCEGGGALYWPARERRGSTAEPPYEPLSDISADEISRDLQAAMDSSNYRIELGKMACLSLYPNGGLTVDALFEKVVRACRNPQSLSIQKSAAAVDITASGVDKGTGVAIACARIGIPLARVACIGDAVNDLPMLRIAGFSACPANASPEVKRLVDFVAPGGSTTGVIQVLRHLVEHEGLRERGRESYGG